MKFSDVLGQDNIKKQLVNLVQSNRLSHALLFHGKEGVGKKALALAFAQYILCENKSETDSCGECPACRKAAKLIHPDVHFVFPVIKDGSKKSVSDSYIKEWREELLHTPYFTYKDWNSAIGDSKKTGQIYVDESNEIIKKLNFKAFESDYKVMLIWLPEKMNTQTANKLLKTLEEPAEKTVLILIAENIDFMLSTILSRVQQVKIPPIEANVIKTYLSDNFSASDDQIEFAYHFSKGQLNKAIEAIKQNESNQMYHKWFVNYMRLSFTNKMLELIELNDQIIAHDKNDLKSFLAYAIRYVRDNFMLNLNQKDLVALVETEANFAAKFSNYINENNIDKIYTSLNKAIASIERNANVKIQMQVLAIELIRAFKMV